MLIEVDTGREGSSPRSHGCYMNPIMQGHPHKLQRDYDPRCYAPARKGPFPQGLEGHYYNTRYPLRVWASVSWLVEPGGH